MDAKDGRLSGRKEGSSSRRGIVRGRNEGGLSKRNVSGKKGERGRGKRDESRRVKEEKESRCQRLKGKDGRKWRSEGGRVHF
jgi:hypothetical protein